MSSTVDSIATPLVRGVLGALSSLGVALAAVVVPALAAQVAASASSATALDAILIALNVLILGHGGGIVLATGVIDGAVTLTPFGLLILLMGLSALSMRRVGRALRPVRDDGVLRVGALRDVGSALGMYTLVYAIGLAVLASVGRSSDSAPVVTSALVSGAMVALLGGLVGLLWSLRREPTEFVPGVRVLDLLPTPYGDIARSAVLAVGGLLWMGGATVVVLLVVSVPSQAALFDGLAPGIIGGLVLTLVQLALLPLIAVWALTVLLGGTVGGGHRDRHLADRCADRRAAGPAPPRSPARPGRFPGLDLGTDAPSRSARGPRRGAPGAGRGGSGAARADHRLGCLPPHGRRRVPAAGGAVHGRPRRWPPRAPRSPDEHAGAAAARPGRGDHRRGVGRARDTADPVVARHVPLPARQGRGRGARRARTRHRPGRRTRRSCRRARAGPRGGGGGRRGAAQRRCRRRLSRGDGHPGRRRPRPTTPQGTRTPTGATTPRTTTPRSMPGRSTSSTGRGRRTPRSPAPGSAEQIADPLGHRALDRVIALDASLLGQRHPRGTPAAPPSARRTGRSPPRRRSPAASQGSRARPRSPPSRSGAP